MSDAKLRELERRWKETGSPDDEAAYLLERVRVGDLTQERLELAAYCGHEGARRASASHKPMGDNWISHLASFPPEVQCQIGVVAAKTAYSEWIRVLGRRDPSQEEIVGALDQWVACPCKRHATRVRDLVQSSVAIDSRAQSFRAAGDLPAARAPSSLWSAAMACHSLTLKGRLGTRSNEAVEAVRKAFEVLAADDAVALCAARLRLAKEILAPSRPLTERDDASS